MARFAGKLVGGLLGLTFGGPVGAVIGVFAGHLLDRSELLGAVNAPRLAEVRREYFRTSFLLFGQLAKADGRISEQEVQITEHIMRQMGITGAQRDEAIELFKQGAEPGFDMEPVVANFNQVCRSRIVKQALVMFLFNLAAADGRIDPAEFDLLRRTTLLLGYSQAQFEQLARMAQAEMSFRTGGTPSDSDALADAYSLLGVEPDCTDKELKHAYRRQMSQNHPDKLIAKGVPEEMVKSATERSQKIQAAYELAKEQRGL